MGASSPDALLAELSPDRVELLGSARALVNRHLLPGFVEGVSGEMIVWTAGDGPGAPMYAALASQKNYAALYLQGVYASSEASARLRAAYAAAGRKLDMGKSCLRFRAADELDEAALGEALRAWTAEGFRAAVG